LLKRTELQHNTKFQQTLITRKENILRKIKKI